MKKPLLKKTQWLKLAEDFLDHLEVERSLSFHTLSAYKRDLQHYLFFLKTKDKHTKNFYEYLDQKAYSPRSKARIISALRSWFKYLENKNITVNRPFLNPVRISPSIPRPLYLKEFQLLLEGSRNKKKPYRQGRNHLTLSLLFGLGLRVSEVLNLSLTHINEIDQSLVVRGKRGKQRLMPLNQELYQQIKTYILEHRPSLTAKKTNLSLILNDRGNRPSRVDVWRWLAKWSARAGLSQNKHPHQFRHGFATSLLEQGVDLRSIQMLLGHANIQTTQIYTSVKTGHLKRTIQKHPLHR